MYTPHLLLPHLHCEISAPPEVYFKRVCKIFLLANTSGTLGSALLNGFLKKKKKKRKSLPWPCLPSTSITEARHSDCYLFCHNYYHEISMITALVILLIINSTNAVIHQQRLAALWRRGPYAHGYLDFGGL